MNAWPARLHVRKGVSLLAVLSYQSVHRIESGLQCCFNVMGCNLCEQFVSRIAQAVLQNILVLVLLKLTDFVLYTHS